MMEGKLVGESQGGAGQTIKNAALDAVCPLDLSSDTIPLTQHFQWRGTAECFNQRGGNNAYVLTHTDTHIYKCTGSIFTMLNKLFKLSCLKKTENCLRITL